MDVINIDEGIIMNNEKRIYDGGWMVLEKNGWDDYVNLIGWKNPTVRLGLGNSTKEWIALREIIDIYMEREIVIIHIPMPLHLLIYEFTIIL